MNVNSPIFPNHFNNISINIIDIILNLKEKLNHDVSFARNILSKISKAFLKVVNKPVTFSPQF